MPNRLMPWNAIASIGNPTKSIGEFFFRSLLFAYACLTYSFSFFGSLHASEVNPLIKLVKKQRYEKKGKRSSARRAITMEEFLTCLDILKEDYAEDYKKR